MKKPTKAKKPRAKKQTNGMMVVKSPINPGQEFVVASELADDEAIEQELLGKAMESYVYSFPQEGKTVTGLTVSGVNEISRLLTKKSNSGIKIRIVPDSINIDTKAEMEGEKGISVTLIAENMLTGETAIGAKFEPYMKKGRKGPYKNTFSLEKAVSKAERNAKRKLIPEKAAIEMINKFVKQGNVQQIGQPAPQGRWIANSQAPMVNVQKSINEVNYLSKFIKTLAEASGIKINGNLTKEQVEIMIEIYNSWTGQNIKSLKVAQSTAQKYLLDLINCPSFNKK